MSDLYVLAVMLVASVVVFALLLAKFLTLGGDDYY